MHTVYLSLGGNFENSDLLILQAIEELEMSNEILNFSVSRMHTTAPVDISDSNAPFKNVCACFETELSPQELFELTEEIEKDLGKEPKPKTASRPIDIDILLFGDQKLDQDLTIPHPKWKSRLFVLEPLMELTDTVYDPELEAEVDLKELAASLTPQTV